MRKSSADLISEIQERMGDHWIPRIYRERILRMRTRSYDFPPLPKHPTAQIHHTLLGIELKVGRRRMLCPDLATARYLSIFARAGCRAVAIPYDITRISHLADELESSWHRMFLLAGALARHRSSAFQTRIGQLLIATVRDEVSAAGVGTRIPEFTQSTKQRDR